MNHAARPITGPSAVTSAFSAFSGFPPFFYSPGTVLDVELPTLLDSNFLFSKSTSHLPNCPLGCIMKLAAKLPLRILTHNIRYATSSPFKGERPWAERRQLLLNELQYNTRHQNAFICLQEVLHNQLVDIHTGLNSSHSDSASQTWEYIGVGRDDGFEAGEYSPIFYQPTVWELRDWETVWLSETPSVPSKSWDAASTRIVTVGVFTHRASRRTVLALNTHLDDQGSRSRYEAAHIILGKVEEYRTRSAPFGGRSISGVFLAGDFNSQEDQEAYTVLTAPESPLADAAKLVAPTEHYGHYVTWTGFGYEGQPPTRIDYILLESTADKVCSHGRQPWTVEGYAVLENRFEDGIFNSDHRAVVVDVLLGE
ncbi:endonuclease/exonuclease/phosphatase family protein [Aspergillus homomorphus CBS 101889]|uniref:Endonuclease/exonuclease/phosphatase family protein n=1 Tax=Aspergillus homomorphus (strain CBS 101889) TaxID=1450537 RepID=A0A395I9L7_ASPHC|nr:endonuclease/exonuclease/phosphatase family protein [Aspergillus homomorphus CBS 101889]RAL14834.1 endonuclease/exonuclease/phosphatase family protein [Aspergillus homomorphus CBS 101889]